MENQQAPISEVLPRIAGGVMIVGAIWNLIYAVWIFIWTIWVCIGVWWLVPAILSIVQIGLGIFTIIKGHEIRPLAFSPFLGVVVSICNLNFCGLFVDVIAVGLGLGGYFSHKEPT